MVCIDTVSRSVLRAMLSMLMADRCPCSANIRLTCRLRSCNRFSYCDQSQRLNSPPPTEESLCWAELDCTYQSLSIVQSFAKRDKLGVSGFQVANNLSESA